MGGQPYRGEAVLRAWLINIVISHLNISLRWLWLTGLRQSSEGFTLSHRRAPSHKKSSTSAARKAF